MRNQLVKSMEYNESLNMMSIAKDGTISKRKIKVLQVGEVSYRASKRTFTIDNVLALFPSFVKRVG